MALCPKDYFPRHLEHTQCAMHDTWIVYSKCFPSSSFSFFTQYFEKCRNHTPSDSTQNIDYQK